MSEAAEPQSQPKPRRGRPPGRKRKDPIDAPVDGDYQIDSILNKEAGKRYALLDKDDFLMKFKHRGYRKVERTAEGARPVLIDDEDIGSGYQVRGLTLYECDEDRALAYDEKRRSISEGRMAAINAAAERTGGYMTRTHQTMGK